MRLCRGYLYPFKAAILSCSIVLLGSIEVARAMVLEALKNMSVVWNLDLCLLFLTVGILPIIVFFLKP